MSVAMGAVTAGAFGKFVSAGMPTIVGSSKVGVACKRKYCEA